MQDQGDLVDNVQDLSLDEAKSGLMEGFEAKSGLTEGFEKVVAEISKGLQVEEVLREEMVKGGMLAEEMVKGGMLPQGTEECARAIVEGVRIMEEQNGTLEEPMDVAI